MLDKELEQSCIESNASWCIRWQERHKTLRPHFPRLGVHNGSVFDGKLIPEWRDNLFIAAHMGQHVVRLVLKGDRVVGEERMLLDQKQMMRWVGQGPDGALWVLTDDADGRLIRLAARGR